MFRIQKMRPLVFNLVPWEFFENLEILSKFGKNRRKYQICYLEKGVLELWFSFPGPQQTNSDFQTGLRSSGLTVLEKRDFPMKVDDCAQAHNSHWQIFFKLHLIWLCYGKHLVFCKTMILTKRGYLYFSGNIFDIIILYNKIVKLEIQLC